MENILFLLIKYQKVHACYYLHSNDEVLSLSLLTGTQTVRTVVG